MDETYCTIVVFPWCCVHTNKLPSDSLLVSYCANHEISTARYNNSTESKSRSSWPPSFRDGGSYNSWLCPHPPYFLPQQQTDDDSNVGVRKLPTHVPNPACTTKKIQKYETIIENGGVMNHHPASVRRRAACKLNFFSMHPNNPTHIYSSLHM